MKKITMQDIAVELGITKTTVHRAFNNKDNVSPDLRAKIQGLAEKYGYKPNRLAKSLSMKSNAIKIGVIIKKEPQYFWGIVKKGILDADHELLDFGLKVIYQELQSLQPGLEDYKLCFDKLMEEKVDGIALFPMNFQGLKELVNDVSEKGIKVATFNDDLDGCSRIFYIGPKRRQFGRLAGELMGKFLQGKGNIVAYWDKEYNSVEYYERIQGFNDVLAEKFPDVHVIGYVNRQFDWFSNTEAFCSVDGIYFNDLDSNLSQIINIKKRTDSKRIVCIGHELSANLVEYIKDGTITASIKQDAYFQGYMVVKQLFECIFEKRLPEKCNFDVAFDIVLAENIEQFMKYLSF